MTRRAVSGVLVASLIALTIAAVGHAASSTTLQLKADPNGRLRYNMTTLTAKAGKVTIVMSNPSSSHLKHGIAVQGNGVDKDGKVVPAGKTSTLTVTLKPGKYTFYCNFDGHKKLGMKGTLTVK
jgi:uncharacterized cupredoxin-like copper-binding protein